MIRKLILLAIKISFGRSIAEIIHGLNERLTGHRTEIIASIAVIISVLEHLGIIQRNAAEKIIPVLLGLLPVTLSEKIGRVLEDADKILPS